tara:strand:+ start:560 stop:739 length:180 start_codon:yes stop_codon:yes gene_type:complete
MKNSEQLDEFLVKANRASPERQLGVFSTVALVEYALLTIGLSIILILTFILIRKESSKQ